MLIALCVLIPFCRLFVSEFTWWDDHETIHHNPVLNPPTWASVASFWTGTQMGLYVPVTYTFWAAIAKIAYIGEPDEFGIYLNPWFFHTANVALHVVATFMVFSLLRRLLADPRAALFGTVLFAVHPLQVESVAWISGMKDLLCWIGTLGCCLLYLRRSQSTQGRSMWASWELPTALVVMALAILSKPTAMVAPAAMLAIGVIAEQRPWRRTTAELLPFFAMSAAAAVVARIVQTVHESYHVPMSQRPLIIGDALCFYLTKLVFPFPLTPDYGRNPTVALQDPVIYVTWIVPLVIGVACLAVWRRAPLLTLAGALALIGVSPVSGIATFQMQQYSTTTDHYVYFSMIGPALALGVLIRRWPSRRVLGTVAAILSLLAVRSFDQTKVWHDTFSMLNHVFRVNPRSWMAANNLASAYMMRLPPAPELAEPYTELAIKLDPSGYYSFQNYAIVKGTLGNREAAIEGFNRVWGVVQERGVPASFQSRVARRAMQVLDSLEAHEEVLNWSERAIRADPDDHEAKRFRQKALKAIADRATSSDAAVLSPADTRPASPVEAATKPAS